MSLKVEKLENNKAKLTIEVTAEEFDKALDQAFQKNKGKITAPGFRKGKVPRAMIEKMYGVGVFYEDAANIVIPDAYAKELENCEEEIVSQPKIDVVQIEKGKPFIFTAEVALKPVVTLGTYKGIKVDKEKEVVTDEEVAAEIDRVREQNSRTVPVEGRAVADKDIAIIDFEGFVDGKAFEGGKGTDYSLTIGSHSFIDTFEEQLIGKNIGEEVEVNVTFPEDYNAEELKGKAAMFKVTVKELKVKELPAFDDDFAQDVSEFDAAEDYKKDLTEKLLDKKKASIKRDVENKAIEAIIKDSKMDIPDEMVDEQVKVMAEDFGRRLQSQGLDIKQYFKYTGLTPEKMMEDMRPQAIQRIQSRLILEAIAEAEKIEVTDEDVEKEIANMASMYQMEVDKLKELVTDKEKVSMKKDIAVEKAADFVVANVK